MLELDQKIIVVTHLELDGCILYVRYQCPDKTTSKRFVFHTPEEAMGEYDCLIEEFPSAFRVSRSGV